MNDIAQTPRVITRCDVEAIEALMKELPQVEIPVRHDFSAGICARTIFIPKGTRLTGRVHKFENMNILSQGEISVLTDKGFERIKAPNIIVSPPGTKRIAIAHEDCVWTTIIATNMKDTALIEQHFTCESECDYLEFQRAQIAQGD